LFLWLTNQFQQNLSSTLLFNYNQLHRPNGGYMFGWPQTAPIRTIFDEFFRASVRSRFACIYRIERNRTYCRHGIKVNLTFQDGEILMNTQNEPSFRQSVDLMFNRAVALMDLPPGLEEKIRVCNATYTVRFGVRLRGQIQTFTGYRSVHSEHMEPV
jgi:hypothetical protein